MLAFRKRTRTLKKQRGGAGKLYEDLDSLSEEAIEQIFCNGGSLATLPQTDKPFFILRWGPPGSGKSSPKVMNVIRSITGLDLPNFLDFSSDLILESYFPFRAETAMMKMRTLRARANIGVRDFTHAKGILAELKKDIKDPALKVEVEDLNMRWSFGKPPPEDWTDERISELLQNILMERTSNLYRRIRKENKNTSGRTLLEKMDAVLARAFGRKVHILYETMGGGYVPTEGDIQQIDDRTARVLARGQRQGGPAAPLFRNPWEGLLGRILFDETGKGVRIQEVSPMMVPSDYKIIVVYPLLDRDIIVQRALKRSILMFMDPKSGDARDVSKATLAKFFEDMIGLLDGKGVTSGGQERRDQIREFIEALIRQEQEASQIPFDKTYRDFLQEQLNMRIKSGDDESLRELLVPFYRALPIQKIYDTVAEAFQYSIDYFIKQYLFLSRIDQVIYVNSATPL